MRIRIPLIAVVSLVALAVQSTALAYVGTYTRGVYTGDTTRRFIDKRDYHATPAATHLDSSWGVRSASEIDQSGRAHLGRVRARRAQRNYKRHYLGWQRGGDHRVLNVSGDLRRQRSEYARTGFAQIPFFIRTGVRQHGDWLHDRVTRRSEIRQNRNQDILSQICRYNPRGHTRCQ